MSKSRKRKEHDGGDDRQVKKQKTTNKKKKEQLEKGFFKNVFKFPFPANPNVYFMAGSVGKKKFNSTSFSKKLQNTISSAARLEIVDKLEEKNYNDVQGDVFHFKYKIEDQDVLLDIGENKALKISNTPNLKSDLENYKSDTKEQNVVSSMKLLSTFSEINNASDKLKYVNDFLKLALKNLPEEEKVITHNINYHDLFVDYDKDQAPFNHFKSGGQNSNGGFNITRLKKELNHRINTQSNFEIVGSDEKRYIAAPSSFNFKYKIQDQDILLDIGENKAVKIANAARLIQDLEQHKNLNECSNGYTQLVNSMNILSVFSRINPKEANMIDLFFNNIKQSLPDKPQQDIIYNLVFNNYDLSKKPFSFFKVGNTNVPASFAIRNFKKSLKNKKIDENKDFQINDITDEKAYEEISFEDFIFKFSLTEDHTINIDVGSNKFLSFKNQTIYKHLNEYQEEKSNKFINASMKLISVFSCLNPFGRIEPFFEKIGVSFSNTITKPSYKLSHIKFERLEEANKPKALNIKELFTDEKEVYKLFETKPNDSLLEKIKKEDFWLHVEGPIKLVKSITLSCFKKFTYEKNLEIDCYLNNTSFQLKLNDSTALQIDNSRETIRQIQGNSKANEKPSIFKVLKSFSYLNPK